MILYLTITIKNPSKSLTYILTPIFQQIVEDMTNNKRTSRNMLEICRDSFYKLIVGFLVVALQRKHHPRHCIL